MDVGFGFAFGFGFDCLWAMFDFLSIHVVAGRPHREVENHYIWLYEGVVERGRERLQRQNTYVK